MSIQLKTIIATGALLIGGVATVSAVTINQPVKVPPTNNLIPIATGTTMTVPNVTPQRSTGVLQGSAVTIQGSNYQVQTPAKTNNQYLLGNIQ